MGCLLLIANLLVILHAESGADAWLRHAPLDDAAARPYRASLPAAVASYTTTAVAQSAQRELLRGIRGMPGRTLRVHSSRPVESAFVLGTLADPGLEWLILHAWRTLKPICKIRGG